MTKFRSKGKGKDRKVYPIKKTKKSYRKSYNTPTYLEYFDTTSTDMSYYDGLMKNPAYYLKSKGVVGKITIMSPDEYMYHCAKSRSKPSTIAHERRMISEEHKDNLKKWQRAGNKFPLPVVDYEYHEQEGRHRVMVAEDMGMDEIPVLVVRPAKFGSSSRTHKYESGEVYAEATSIWINDATDKHIASANYEIKTKEKEMWIGNIAVWGSEQNKGYGNALLETIIKEQERLKLPLYLRAVPKNVEDKDKLIRYYKSKGFEYHSIDPVHKVPIMVRKPTT